MIIYIISNVANSDSINNYINFKDIVTEIIKVLATGILGYFTFRIYQRYKNKKANNILFVFLVKLQSEFNDKTKEIKEVVANSNKLKELENLFMLESDSKIYEVYDKVSKFYRYLDEEMIYEYGEVVDIEYVYSDRPYHEIHQLQSQVSYIEFSNDGTEEEIENLKSYINELEGRSLINEIKEVEEMLERVEIPDKHTLSINYLRRTVGKFNSLSDDEKKEKLDSFCNYLIEQENIFSSLLKKYKELTLLKHKLKKPRSISNKSKMLEIEFDRWNTDDDKDLLAEYNVKKYITIDDLYRKNMILKIHPWDVVKCKKVLTEELNILEKEISEVKKTLDKSISKTDLFFKNL